MGGSNASHMATRTGDKGQIGLRDSDVPFDVPFVIRLEIPRLAVTSKTTRKENFAS